MEGTKKNKLSNLQIEYFCEQMSMILRSGISPLEGITIMKDDSESEEDKSFYQQLQENLEETGFLYDALDSCNMFPNYVIQMVRLGETTGSMDDVMDSLAAFYRQREAISVNIRNAVSYPILMITMMFFVMIVMMTQVLPIFEKVLNQLGSEMTGFSKGLLSLGTAINHYAFAFIVLVIVLVLIAFYFFKTQKGRQQFTKLSGKLYFTKGIQERTAAARFANGMALTIRSGLDVDTSFSLLYDMTESPAFQKKLDDCKSYMDEGCTFQEAISKAHVFRGIQSRMLAIGSTTGNEEQVLDTISTQYEEEIDENLSRIISIVEPTLVIILSLLVGVILISVMLPLLGIMSNIG